MSINQEMLYKILTIGYYNSERRRLFYTLLKRYLETESECFDINSEISKMNFDMDENYFSSGLFKNFDSIITSGLSPEPVIEYLDKRYIPYEDIFFERYKIPLISFISIAFELLFFIDKRKEFKIIQNVYQFKSKENYMNLKFIAYPTNEYIEAYKKVYTVDINEFKKILIPELRQFLDKFIQLYSFTIDKIKHEPDLRIKEYPLLNFENKLIFVDPFVYLRYVCHKIHLLLNGCKDYDARKGKLFEKLALDLIEKAPHSKLEDRNIFYNQYELDGLLNFKNSTWFIECKSRNISSDSLKGNNQKILNDVKRAITDSIKQGARAIENIKCTEFSKYAIKPNPGIIVILEGLFPNIRLPKVIGTNPIDECKYPVCVFNYFELKNILKQHDVDSFEEFLIWRSQKEMPIYALDECDYWAFFNDKYQKDESIREAFKHCIKNNNTIMYISERFNKKDYLNSLI